MERYYFTFGSWTGFPYRDTYLIVVASGRDDAVQGFREKFPDVNSGILNCSFCYSEEEWKGICKRYMDCGPAEVVWTEGCFGKKPEGYDDLFLYVPEERQIVRIAEGTGDNLFQEDIDAGYEDYIYYSQYMLVANMPEVDGGIVLLKEQLRDKYRCLADSIPDVLDMAYGSCLTGCMILR